MAETEQSHREARTSGLQVGQASVDMTPAVGGPLAGSVTRHGRFSTAIHDRLHARAIHLVGPDEEITVLAADILVITPELHRAVAAEAGVSPERLLASATHTHSGPGGYWAHDLPQRFMGPYDEGTFRWLVERLAAAAKAARREVAPASVSAASNPVRAACNNRRRERGPVDPELTLVRFDVEGAAPVDLVAFGAHPVIGSETAPHLVTGDFPGAICARLEASGSRPLFFQGSVGGTSPLFPELPLPFESHLALMTDVLEGGVREAERALEPVRVEGPRARIVEVPLPPVQCRVFPPEVPLSPVAEAATIPLRRWMRHRGEEALPADRRAPLHLVELGDVVLVGTPCDLGVTVGLEMKRLLRERGVRHPLPGSQVDAYVGYVHLPEDYARKPEKGYRFMAFYENAMSLSGWEIGRRFVEAVDRATIPGGTA
ncbi:MAG: neutral/alkaline non-lysosomal ceramidase N-terminal domain-containing protein [Myxococcota bacterium]